MTVILPLIIQVSPRYDGHIGMYLIEVDFEVVHDVFICRHQFRRDSDRRARSCTQRWEPVVDVVLDWRVWFDAVFPLSPDIRGFDENKSADCSRMYPK